MGKCLRAWMRHTRTSAASNGMLCVLRVLGYMCCGGTHPAVGQRSGHCLAVAGGTG